MPRLFIVFRTFDRIWQCGTYTRELAKFEFDTSCGHVKLMFTVDPVVFQGVKDNQLELCPHAKCQPNEKTNESIFCVPHECFKPKVLSVRNKQRTRKGITPKSSGSNAHAMRRYSLPTPKFESTKVPEPEQDVYYYVLPMFKCTFLLDAHLSSCISTEVTRSRLFRKRFLRYLRCNGGFRNCIPDYESWSAEEQNLGDHYLSVPYMIDMVTVWPRQKLDYSWCSKILSLLNKHIALEEGFAWLSTLGGAHSALGEIFIQHAERAGEISKQQLKVAVLLGNDQMIARCFVFWAWSLMQRGDLASCKTCVRNVWSYSKRLRCRDTILENMCLAVWSRLRYKLKVLKSQRPLSVGGTAPGGDRDSTDDGHGGPSHPQNEGTSGQRHGGPSHPQNEGTRGQRHGGPSHTQNEGTRGQRHGGPSHLQNEVTRGQRHGGPSQINQQQGVQHPQQQGGSGITTSDSFKPHLEATLKGTPGCAEATQKGTPGLIEASLKGTPGLIEASLKGTPSCTEASLKGTPGCTEASLKGTPSCTEASLKGTPSCAVVLSVETSSKELSRSSDKINSNNSALRDERGMADVVHDERGVADVVCFKLVQVF